MRHGRRSQDSPFLKFTTAEFHRRGTKLRRDLSNKTLVHQLLEGKTLGGAELGLPAQHAVLNSTDQITSELLGERAALKFAHGWSAKGVMLLERVAENRYFDHMALREWTLEGIRQEQQKITEKFPRKKSAWIVEDFLRGAQPGGVPYDYKFYMFQGQIGVIAQIDRNSSPVRAAMLDGAMKPLVPGRDYYADANDIQPAAPLVPRSAVMLSRWAIELSKMTDAPFARIDLYDTEDGPYFGEFTFSTGAEIKGRVIYSHRMLAHLDELFADAQKELRGEPVEARQSWSRLLQSAEPERLAEHPMVDLELYKRYSYYLHNQGSLGGHRLARAEEALSDHGGYSDIAHHLRDAHRAAARHVDHRLDNRPSELRRVATKVYRKVAGFAPDSFPFPTR